MSNHDLEMFRVRYKAAYEAWMTWQNDNFGSRRRIQTRVLAGKAFYQGFNIGVNACDSDLENWKKLAKEGVDQRIDLLKQNRKVMEQNEKLMDQLEMMHTTLSRHNLGAHDTYDENN